jgi:hypothetical protein
MWLHWCILWLCLLTDASAANIFDSLARIRSVLITLRNYAGHYIQKILNAFVQTLTL